MTGLEIILTVVLTAIVSFLVGGVVGVMAERKYPTPPGQY